MAGHLNACCRARVRAQQRGSADGVAVDRHRVVVDLAERGLCGVAVGERLGSQPEEPINVERGMTTARSLSSAST
jgi:hypothetical protein